MTLYERWKEDGMRVLCDKDSVKAFEELGYKLDKCPCEYVAPEVAPEEVAEIPVEIVEEVAEEKQSKRSRKKSQEDTVEEKVVEEKTTGPDIIL